MSVWRREDAARCDARPARAPENAADPSPRVGYPADVDAAAVAAAVQHPGQVLGGDVAGSPWRERAASDAGRAGVMTGHPFKQGGVDVAKSGHPGLMEMC